MSSRLIAIGDIHGCRSALATLLDAISPEPGDVIVTLGDYIDRGPDSRGVIEQLIQLSGECKLRPLLGNHEIMLLAAMDGDHEYRFWRDCGGSATLASYGGHADNIPADHFAFIRGCLPYFETPEFFFVHANYEAGLPLREQPADVLFWKHLMYGVPPRHTSGKTAVVGHTPQPTGQVLDLGHILCLDTYCFGRGYLTAMDVESREIWQSDKHGQLRTSE